jgi:hypothetical protein
MKPDKKEGARNSGSGWGAKVAVDYNFYAFAGEMRREADRRRDVYSKQLYDLSDFDSYEIRSFAETFANELVRKLNSSTFDKDTGEWAKSFTDPVKRWHFLKETIPQNDLDNLMELVQRATDYKINYKNGMLTVEFNLADRVEKYQVLINEEAAARWAEEFPGIKQWIADVKAKRKTVDAAGQENQVDTENSAIAEKNRKCEETKEKMRTLNTPEAARLKLDEIAGNLPEGFLPEDLREGLKDQLAAIAELISESSVDNSGVLAVDSELVSSLMDEFVATLGNYSKKHRLEKEDFDTVGRTIVDEFFGPDFLDVIGV